MDITPLIRKDAQVIQSYKNGRFTVSKAIYDGAVMVTPHRTALWDISAFTAQDNAQMNVGDFAAVMAQCPPETGLVLFGTGSGFVLYPPSFRRDFRAAYGVTVDIMDSGAAARAYNVLLAEGRDIVALLLPVNAS